MITGTILATLLGVSTLAPPPAASSQTDVRRVEVSVDFAGQSVFVFGHVAPGTKRVAAVMTAASPGPIRLMEKGRIALFWLGIHQYRLEGAPGVYLVNMSCPLCNGMGECRHGDALDACNRLLAGASEPVGPEAVRARITLARLSGALAPEETNRVLDGFWSLQAKRGLFGVRTNAIRISSAETFYHVFTLPAAAPEARYRITTYFFSEDRLLGQTENEIIVRKTGLLFWLSRLSDRHAFAYGAMAVLIAVAAGWIAGTLFRRTGH
jgi:hypothetical protein